MIFTLTGKVRSNYAGSRRMMIDGASIISLPESVMLLSILGVVSV